METLKDLYKKVEKELNKKIQLEIVYENNLPRITKRNKNYHVIVKLDDMQYARLIIPENLGDKIVVKDGFIEIKEQAIKRAKERGQLDREGNLMVFINERDIQD